MRREVTKYLFYGADVDREAFFKAAQSAGVIEFNDMGGGAGFEVPDEISTLVHANKVLRHLEPVVQEELDSLALAEPVAKEIVGLQDEIDRLHEEDQQLAQEIHRVQVFGDFSIDDIEYIEANGRRSIQFFCAKSDVHPEAADSPEVIFVGKAFDLDYYVAINTEPKSYPGLVEMTIDHPLGQLDHRRSQVADELHAAEAKLKTFAKRKEAIKSALIAKTNAFRLQKASAGVHTELNGNIFLVEGWLPTHKLRDVTTVVDRFSVQVERIAIDKGDRVPSYLQNKALARVGEDLVHIYDAPSTTDRDPSRWVLWFFCLFFGLIVNDAGYGVILLIPGVLLSYRFRNSPPGVGKRFASMVLMLSISCIVVGILTGSYFGIGLSPYNWLQDFSLVDWFVREKIAWVIETKGPAFTEWVDKYPALANMTTVDQWLETATKIEGGEKVYFLHERFSDSVMLELALFIGVVHLCIAFLRVIDRNWAGAGWICFMIGGYLYFPTMLGASSMLYYVVGVDPAAAGYYGMELLWIGLGGAVALALIQHRLGGLTEIFNVIQVFSDVLSYLRLYALGLAGMMLSTTFNDMAVMAGPVFGIAIILVGHTVNISLAIMGGIIHGLRLNFLEWYRHCFDGGGKMLNPLKLLKIPEGGK